MTAPDLTEAERAIVERFERAPDALTEVAREQANKRAMEYAVVVAALLAGRIDGQQAVASITALSARMVAEAADAREAEVRAELSTELANTPAAAAERAGRAAGAAGVRERVEALGELGVREQWPPDEWRAALRAALAPADNDGEAGR